MFELPERLINRDRPVGWVGWMDRLDQEVSDWLYERGIIHSPQVYGRHFRAQSYIVIYDRAHAALFKLTWL